MSLFSGSQEAGILLIDGEHRIVYFNAAVGDMFHGLRKGDLCYQGLYGENAPCRNCPLCVENGVSILYSKETSCWMEVSAGTMELPDGGENHLMLLKSIQEENKDLFLGLTKMSAYDELYEVNLSADQYKVLYHQENKYAIPLEGGALSSLLAEASERMIHPDDRSGFHAFWNIEHLLKQIEQGTTKNYQARFRQKLLGGDWCWVLQTLVPVRREENGDQIVMCFVQDVSQQSHGDAEAYDVDRLTGLYRRDKFLSAARKFLESAGTERCCLMAIDIEHFKLFNEWYGQEAGDRFLVDIGSRLKEAERRTGGVAGYMGNDDFAILLPDAPDALSELQSRIMGCVKQYGDQAGFQPAFGLYTIEDPADSVRKMYDRASIALSSVKGNYIQRSCWYDAGMMADLEESHRLLSQIQQALEREEFIFYAQPMCNMATGKIVGLESLVRWNHPERGVINPGEFVPLLERTGFIAILDQYIWDKVCASVRRWIDAGRRAVPISVNMSRADLYTLDVVECFANLIKRYELEPRLIHIEITESAYAEDFPVITDVVDKLRHAGFTVLMDDFGSGYSSLNMLKDIKLDLLKLDMKFLELNDRNAGTGSEIVEAITSMAHLMGLRVIAEGVETEKQMKFLLDIGCLYGQGYYFYRPMPIETFEPLLADENNIDFRGIQPTTVEGLKLREMLNGDWLSEAVVNNILGGAAVYGLCGNRVELLRANQQYCKVTHTNAVELEEDRQSLLENVYLEDQPLFLDVFRRAQEDTVNGAEVEVRRVLPDCESIWVHVRAFFLREQDGYSLFYGSVTDVTEPKRRELQLENSQRALTAAVKLSENDEGFMCLTEENQRMAASIFAQMTPGGMIGGYCEEEFPLYFANHEMVKLLGYETYGEFAEGIHYKVANTIHPGDRDRVAQDLGTDYYAGMEYTTTYRMPKKDGSWFWTLDKGRVIQTEDGRLAIVSACTDISETMMAQEKLAERNAMLLRQNQELNFLNRDMPGGYHRCSNTPGFEFIYVSDRFLAIFGYTRQEIRELFDDKFLNMVHPDDRRMVAAGTAEIKEGAVSTNLEYRMLSKHGYIWVVDQSRYMDYANKRFFQGVIIDITETVTLRNKLQMLLKNMPEDIILVTAHDGQYRCEAMINGLSRERGIDLAAYQRSLDVGSYQDYIEKEEFYRVKEKIDKAMTEKDNYQDVMKLINSDGSPLWASVDARYIKDGPEGTTYLFLFGDVTEIKEQERALRLAGEQTESILRQAGINSWEWNIPRDLLILRNVLPNPALTEKYPILGMAYAEVENFSTDGWKLISLPEEYRAVIKDGMERARAGKNLDHFQYDVPVNAANGETIWLRIACEILRDEKNRPVKSVGYYTDVTAQKAQTLQSREDQKTLELLRKQALYDFKVNLTHDTVGSLKSLQRWTRETGGEDTFTYTEMVHFLADHLILPEFREQFLVFSNRERMLKQGHEEKMSEDFEYQRLVNGRPRWMHMVIHYVRFEDSPDVYVYIFVVDIDQQKRQELELTHLAQTDEMTDLYNRRAAVEIISQSLLNLKGRTAAFIILDLDNFKQANDIFGHVFGDTVLSTVAHNLKNYFRAGDVVCRLGGDEFLVFCQGINQETVEYKLSNIIEHVVLKKSDGKQESRFTLSAGYAMVPEQGDSFDELYRKADMALFAAKADGKGKLRKFNPSMKAVHNKNDEEGQG